MHTCSTHEDGCKWSGEINDLQSHLDKHCPHATVTCKYICGDKIAKCQKENHESIACHNRPLSCFYCKMTATAKVIDIHTRTCDAQFKGCTNKCGAKIHVRRLEQDLRLHLEQCPLQPIPCEFKHAGCDTNIVRKDYDKHIEENSQKHLRLLSRSLADTTRKVHFLSQLHLENIMFKISGQSTSAPLYILGYNMSVKCVRARSAVEVTLILNPGKYDDKLSWPLQGEIVLQLVQAHQSIKYAIKDIQRPSEPIEIATNTCRTDTDIPYMYKLSVDSVVFI